MNQELLLNCCMILNDHTWIPLMYHFELLSTWVAGVAGEHHFCPHSSEVHSNHWMTETKLMLHKIFLKWDSILWCWPLRQHWRSLSLFGWLECLVFVLGFYFLFPFSSNVQVLVLWQLKCPTSYCICNLGTSLSSNRRFKQTEHNALFRSLICERSVLQYEMMFLNSQPNFMTLGLGTTAPFCLPESSLMFQCNLHILKLLMI